MLLPMRGGGGTWYALLIDSGAEREQRERATLDCVLVILQSKYIYISVCIVR
jgi:hypothetical protein